MMLCGHAYGVDSSALAMLLERAYLADEAELIAVIQAAVARANEHVIRPKDLRVSV